MKISYNWLQGYFEEKLPAPERLDWMFNRISSEERKLFARANYEKWMTELEKFK